MRIWQKIYFLALLLFLIMLNAGLFLAARFIYSYNLNQELKKAETDCYFLCQNLEHDLSVLEKNSRYQDDVVELLFEGYQTYYKKQDITLILKKTEKKEGMKIRSAVGEGGKRVEIFAERNLVKPYETYRICYKKRLTDFEGVWRMLKRMFALISFTMSVLLCFFLYYFMRQMLKPLDKLNESVAKIASGEYESRMAQKGRSAWRQDEIYELSQNVDKMSETIQKQIKALEEENEKKQRLMDNMAHELKTPLTSIYGYAEYLRYAKTKEEEKYDGLTYIMEESRRLFKMSEIMLSMRLYEKEEKPLSAVSLETVAGHIEKILSEKLQEKNLTLEKEFELRTIYGEESLFVNLFRNLLENAVRASKNGGQIVFRAFAKEQKQVFEMTDYGIGMEEGELKRITEAFYRVDKARSRTDGGVGLGLSVADLIVKKMNGTMTFWSKPGEGTKVTVILDCCPTQSQKQSFTTS